MICVSHALSSSGLFRPRFGLALVFWALLLLAGVARAELVVVVNPGNGVDQLSKSQVVNIFLASSREFPDGAPATPIDLAPRDAEFYGALVNRNPVQMDAYWSRLVFSGKASRPRKADRWEDVIQAVAANRSAIGYVDTERADPAHVKVVFVVP
ncbi:MAG: hypothetical protein LBI87_12435 [Candidatus Accumulibacter sp.]|jgi:ABC-type phosphate transport system substrate-binding protein|nr:hypothetical protein [Accumulibacter sp.]